MSRHFRMYYKRWDGNVGIGVEEYTPGTYPTDVKMFASIFLKANITDYDLICKVIDTYCPSESQTKLWTSQMLDRYTLDHLRTRYPNITFRRIRGRHIYGVKDLSNDALRRRSTIVERAEGEQ
jgi:hypothetical protein